MKRVICAAALLILVGLTAAAAGGARHASPTKLTVWVGWSAGKELITFKKVAAEYDKAHPDVTLDVVGGIVDQKIVAAIRAGQAPDVVSSFNSYNVGNYCGTGGWVDLGFQRIIEVQAPSALPSIGGVGVLSDFTKSATLAFKAAGETILLIGEGPATNTRVEEAK